MPMYPLQLPRNGYRGTNPSRRRKSSEFNKAAERLEQHINESIESGTDQTQVFIYGFLAADLGMSVDLIRRILEGVGGHTGITVSRQSDKSVP